VECSKSFRPTGYTGHSGRLKDDGEYEGRSRALAWWMEVEDREFEARWVSASTEEVKRKILDEDYRWYWVC